MRAVKEQVAAGMLPERGSVAKYEEGWRAGGPVAGGNECLLG